MCKKYLISFVIIIIFQSFATLTVNAQLISRDLLIQDVRQLSDILESSHPDPYINGGGKIAFHIRLQSILLAIPDSGMSKPDFVSLIAPLAASVSDAHTLIYDSHTTDWDYPGGVPLYFDVIENFLYVRNVPDSSYAYLIGSTLLSVEGIPLPELIERQKMLKGCDNDYTALAILAGFGSLFQENAIKDLIPEWNTENRIVVKLKLPTGEINEQLFELPWKIKFPFGIKTESSITLPSTKRCDFNYDFMDEKKQTAILKIDGMVGYREDFELSATSHTMNGLKEAWEQYYGTEAPEDQSDIIAGIPSAAEIFKNLVEDMKNAGTKTLIVDVRENTGGNSMMTDFLIFCLFGKEKYYWYKGETANDIEKISDLYFENRPNFNLEQINEESDFQMTKNDYDLRYYCYQNPEKLKSLDVEGILVPYFKMMPSFYSIYESRQKEDSYIPEKIVVLCSAKTFSGGYGLMWGLYKFGAVIIGTPSGQAGNSFTNMLQFTLKNSEIEGQVSSKSQWLFPDDPEKGRVLRPDIELSYDYLKKCGFDKNAAVLLAMEKLDEIHTIR